LSDRADPQHFHDAMQPWTTGAGASAWPSWALSNHDCARVASRWKLDAPTHQVAQFALALLVSLRGTIFVYQGEELGLTQADLAYDDVRDPLGLANWPANKGRDGCRTVLPWSHDEEILGFSTVKPWLPIIETHRDQSVDIQSKDPASVLAFAQSAISFRQSSPALRLGGFSVLYEDEACLIFSRSLGEALCIAGFNFSGETRTVSGLFQSRRQPDLAVGAIQFAEDEVTLGPVSAFLTSINPLENQGFQS